MTLINKIRNLNMKFFYHIFVFVFIIVLASSLTISSILYFRFNLIMSKQSNDFIQHTSTQLKSNIISLFNSCETIAGNVYNNSNIQFTFSGNSRYISDLELYQKYQVIMSSFEGILNTNKMIKSVCIYKLDKELFNSGKEIKDFEEFSNQDLIKKAVDLKGKNLWAYYYENSSNSYKIVLLKYLNIYKPGGVLVIELDEMSIFNLYVNIASDIILYITDENYKVISSNQRESIGNGVDKAIQESIGTASHKGSVMMNGTRYYIFGDSIITNWKLSILYDYHVIEKEKRIVSFYAISTVLIFTLMALMIAYRFSKRFALQVDMLMFKIREIEKGNLDIVPGMERVHEFHMLDKTLCLMAKSIKNLNCDIIKVMKQKKESEIKYLQMQMNPHFLYNLLSAVRWIAFSNKQNDITHIIDHLTNFYKIALSKGNEIIELKDELSLIQSYVELQNMCYSSQIKMNINIDEALMNLKVCKLTLQPFIENSIIHGKVHDKVLNIMVDIIRHKNGGVSFKIQDDGYGVDERFITYIESLNHNNLTQKGMGYGIANTFTRLKYVYEDNVSISASDRNPGTIIEIIIHSL